MSKQRISDRVKIARRYVRAVELQRDLADPDALDGYVLTPSVKETTKRLVAGLAPTSTQRAFRVVGPYGAGKSAFGVFLGQLLRDGSKGRAGKLWAKMEPGKAAIPSWDPLVLSGRRVSIAKEILELLSARGDADAAAELSAKGARDARRVADILASHAKSNAQRTGRGLLLLVDEMGRFLEHAASNIASEDPAIFQEIAERAGGAADVSLGIVAFMHHRFADYVSGLGDWVEAEWARSAERYEELPFGESTEQSLFLLAHALKPGKAHDASVEETAIACYAEAARRGVIAAPDEIVSHAARTLYPLHPAAASTLVHATRKLGQNERSLFGFLQSLEPAGLQRYAHETEYNAENWYRTGAAFDYVLAMAGSRPAGERGRRFALASDALVVSADLSFAHREVLKTIALFSVLEPVPGLKADAETIAWCLGLQPKAVAALIDDLIGRNIVFRRPHRDDLSLWSRSSVDLGQWISDAKKVVPAPRKLEDALATLPYPRPVVAHRHYHQTGTLRTFAIGAMSAPPADGQSDGAILIAPINPGDSAEAVLKRAKKFSASNPLALICIRSVPEPVLRWAHELEIWSWIAKNCEELRVDELARAEVGERIASARHALFEASSPMGATQSDLGTDRWIHRGKLVDLPAGGLSPLLSDICDEVYDKAPLLRNELINRTKLSSAVASARTRLLGKMLTQAGDPYLGLEGAPPERTIYLSMFHASGMHRDIGGGRFAFDRPEDDSQRWGPVWDHLTELLTVDRSVGIVELLAELAAPPYGMRQGPALLLIAAFAIARAENVSLMERNSFQPDLTESHFMRMAKMPANFALRHIERQGAEQDVIAALARGIPSLPGAPCASTAAAIAERLYRWWGALPEFAIETRALSSSADAVRAALRKANDPAELLLRALPQACGIELDEHSVQPYLDVLDAAIAEIGDATPLLRRRVAATMLDAFSAKSVPALRTHFIADFEPHLLSLTANKMRAFVDRALKKDVDDDRWLDGMASVVTGRRVDSWADPTIDEFAYETRAMSASLSRWLALAKTQRAKSADLVAVHVVGVDGSEQMLVVRRDRSHPGRADRMKRVREALGNDPGAAELLSELLAEAIASSVVKKEVSQ